uniref:Putative salivary lipocalin n=1 Tax=Ixodes ricinus TaxID=34613 RepID=A0A0K8R8L7_IXORI
MAVRLSTLLCFIAAAIIQLPEAQSRTTTPPRYDAARELREQFDQKYYLMQRSQFTDTKMGNNAKCVSVLKLAPVFGESSITAQISIKQNRASDPTTNIVVKMTAHTPDLNPTKNMIRITKEATAELLYNQKLVFSDHISCRVLTYEYQGETYCQLWLIHSAVTGSIPRGCSDAYDQYCETKHNIFHAQCLPN